MNAADSAVRGRSTGDRQLRPTKGRCDDRLPHPLGAPRQLDVRSPSGLPSPGRMLVTYILLYMANRHGGGS
jgi:hypothetical protein